MYRDNLTNIIWGIALIVMGVIFGVGANDPVVFLLFGMLGAGAFFVDPGEYTREFDDPEIEAVFYDD